MIDAPTSDVDSQSYSLLTSAVIRNNLMDFHNLMSNAMFAECAKKRFNELLVLANNHARDILLYLTEVDIKHDQDGYSVLQTWLLNSIITQDQELHERLMRNIFFRVHLLTQALNVFSVSEEYALFRAVQSFVGSEPLVHRDLIFTPICQRAEKLLSNDASNKEPEYGLSTLHL